MGSKKFSAQVLSPEQTGEPRNLTSFFQRNVKPQQILPHEPPPEEKTYDI